MKVGLPQLSIGDRVNAAKSDTRPNNTDTSAVPSSLNPSPGPSAPAGIDSSQLDAAGGNVNTGAQQGNKATSDSSRQQNNPAGQNLQYDKQSVDTGDQAPTASKKEELANTPPPKSKGFKESLIDQQLSSGIGNKTGGDHPAQDRDLGHDNGDPNQYVKPQPESQPIRRDKMDPYSNKDNKVPEPSRFPITSFDKENNMEPYKARDQNLGPAYKPKTLNQPKAPNPKVKFNSPKFNTPGFN